jgi:predicted dehydrogenase
LHAEVALAAIAAGKHVLCEMPLAESLQQADRIITAAQQRGVYLMPSLTFRFAPPFVKVKELISQGHLGEPSAVIYREFIAAKDLAKQWPPGAWVWNLKESGGPLYTLAVWSIDLVRWLFSTELADVHSAVKYSPLPQFGGTLGYDACATAQLKNGMAACFQFSGSVAESASSCVLEVVGTSTALVRTTAHEAVTLLADNPYRTEWQVKQGGPRMWGHQQQDEHFIQCLREGRQPSIKPEDGRIAMETAVKIAKCL